MSKLLFPVIVYINNIRIFPKLFYLSYYQAHYNKLIFHL